MKRNAEGGRYTACARSKKKVLSFEIMMFLWAFVSEGMRQQMLKIILPEINVFILYYFLVLNIEFSFSLPRLDFK